MAQKEFKEIYRWEVTLFNGQIIFSPTNDIHLKKNECRFIDLPFQDIKIFELKPLNYLYAPIRIQTHGKIFKYYRRWDKNLLTQEVISCLYIIEAEKVYVIKWPGPEYKIYNIEEFYGNN